ncbi:hypothetical protein GQ43DRAFT_431180 [Delitschia confertaspora ATCC 74209]|uniref:Uncharacterized protein n=1 Tax=Delitschia confertaspora ATCC 74209 TaxID=1513339 RepID=A0A9P4JMB3_9PLEO|nr:hypothetical protein GQ43DRAFT_431180 [Delitschia confertaspora ATCC 74209]
MLVGDDNNDDDDDDDDDDDNDDDNDDDDNDGGYLTGYICYRRKETEALKPDIEAISGIDWRLLALLKRGAYEVRLQGRERGSEGARERGTERQEPYLHVPCSLSL